MIEKSNVINKRKFPSRKDYEKYFGPNYLSNDEMLLSIHSHWHKCGQSGCIFAQNIAKNNIDKSGWKVEVIRNIDIKMIDNYVKKSIEDPHTEVLTILLPEIMNIKDLSKFISKLLKESELFYMDLLHIFNREVCLPLRIDIFEEVSSWVMFFGDFENFPNTRKSPISELVIRVKRRRMDAYKKLSSDQTVAHLADTPYHFGNMDNLWEATYKNTEYILGNKPDIKSAAKTTLTLPIDIYEEYINI